MSCSEHELEIDYDKLEEIQSFIEDALEGLPTLDVIGYCKTLTEFYTGVLINQIVEDGDACNRNKEGQLEFLLKNFYIMSKRIERKLEREIEGLKNEKR